VGLILWRQRNAHPLPAEVAKSQIVAGASPLGVPRPAQSKGALSVGHSDVNLQVGFPGRWSFSARARHDRAVADARRAEEGGGGR